MSENKVPIDKISKLADEIRFINDFSENHNFDNSFLTTPATPSELRENRDTPLIVMITSMFLVLVCTALILFYNPVLSNAMKTFIFLIGLFLTITATITAHLKFKENFITSIVLLGLITLLSISAGMFTPKEALDKAWQLAS